VVFASCSLANRKLESSRSCIKQSPSGLNSRAARSEQTQYRAAITSWCGVALAVTGLAPFGALGLVVLGRALGLDAMTVMGPVGKPLPSDSLDRFSVSTLRLFSLMDCLRALEGKAGRPALRPCHPAFPEPPQILASEASARSARACFAELNRPRRFAFRPTRAADAGRRY
jgi:hypothetical protein